jgi:hypothetical protein
MEVISFRVIPCDCAESFTTQNRGISWVSAASSVMDANDIFVSITGASK